MKILLVHSEDRPEGGPWAAERWDRILDLGFSGESAYREWSKTFAAPVLALRTLPEGEIDLPATGEFLRAAGDRLRDEENLDWWALTAILFYEKAETLTVLRRLAEGLGYGDTVAISRPGFEADALALLLGSRLRCFTGTREAKWQRRLRAAPKLSLGQTLEILGDKYDATYWIRGSFHKFRQPRDRPVVLLPSAYLNVSRTGIAYASVDPQINYLLVATRRSGWQVLPPANVQVAKLASYAQPEARLAEEYREVVARWNQARQELECLPEIGTLARLGVLDAFPKYFRQGLAIRNAWRNVFEREPIQSVLCGDDSNPYTTIPLQLARNRGLPAVAVHHGALDGRQLFKPKLFDVVLAKGRMEEDYLSQVCGIEPSRIEIGAPLDAPGAQPRNAQTQGRSPQAIVFFSEKCEVAGARAEDFYADLLPRLADLAAKHGRKLIIKLHPFESRREREQLVAKTLTPEQRSVTKVVSGTLTPGLLEQTWFGITILSTATTECVMAGVPCFLCAWLDYSHWGYISQFEKFGAGRALKSPEEIDQIPRILASYPWSKSAKKNFWETIDRTRLRELLSSSSATENEHLHARPGDASCELEAIPH